MRERDSETLTEPPTSPPKLTLETARISTARGCRGRAASRAGCRRETARENEKNGGGGGGELLRDRLGRCFGSCSPQVQLPAGWPERGHPDRGLGRAKFAPPTRPVSAGQSRAGRDPPLAPPACGGIGLLAFRDDFERDAPEPTWPSSCSFAHVPRVRPAEGTGGGGLRTTCLMARGARGARQRGKKSGRRDRAAAAMTRVVEGRAAARTWPGTETAVHVLMPSGFDFFGSGPLV